MASIPPLEGSQQAVQEFCSELEWCIAHPGKEDQAAQKILASSSNSELKDLPKEVKDLIMLYHSGNASTTFPFLRHLVIGGYSDDILKLNLSPTLKRLCFELIQNGDIVKLENVALQISKLKPVQQDTTKAVNISDFLSFPISPKDLTSNFITLAPQLLARHQVIKVDLDQQKIFMFFEMLTSAERQCLLLDIGDILHTVAKNTGTKLAVFGSRLISAIFYFLHYFAYKISIMKTTDSISKHPNFVEEVCLAMETFLSIVSSLSGQSRSGGLSIEAVTGHWLSLGIASSSLWIIHGLLSSVVLYLLHTSHPSASNPSRTAASSHLVELVITDLLINAPVEAVVCHIDIMQAVCRLLSPHAQAVCQKRLDNIKAHLV